MDRPRHRSIHQPKPRALRLLPAIQLCAAAVCLLVSVGQAAASGAELGGNALDWRKVVAQADAEELAAQQAGQGQWTIASTSFTLSSTMPDEPELTCYCASPEPRAGKPSPRAQDAVYYFHTPSPGKRNILEDPLCESLVRDAGMTVFGISFTRASDYGACIDPARHAHFYAFAQSGSFAAIADAWTRVRALHAIASPRFFVYGYSAGGIASQHLAEEYPDLVDGAIVANGHTFIEKNKAHCPFLIINTLGDLGLPDGDGLARFYRTLGSPVTRLCLNPNWGLKAEGNYFAFHALNGASTTIAVHYLEGLADLRRKSGKPTVPGVTTWPLAYAVEDPRHLVAIHGPDWKVPFQEAHWTAIPVPSALLYRDVLRLPRPCHRLDLGKFGQAALAGPPVLSPPLGAVVFCGAAIRAADRHDAGAIPFADMDPDLQFASEHHFAAGAVLTSEAIAQILPIAAKECGKGGAQVAAVLFQPEAADITNALAVASLRTLVLVLNDNGYLSPLLPALQRCIDRGLALRILVSCTNQAEYRAFLVPISSDLRERYCASFTAKGDDGADSLHQQQVAAAMAFIEQPQPAATAPK